MGYKKRNIAILGSTGSIGTQALDVIARYPDRFVAYALVAKNRVELLIEQARTFLPEIVVIANETKYEQLSEALKQIYVNHTNEVLQNNNDYSLTDLVLL